MSKQSEQFVMVPVHLVRRLEDETITVAQLGLASVLKYREWRDNGATSFTLSELKDSLGYGGGTEQLRRDLHALDYGTLTAPPPGKGRWKWSSGGGQVETEVEVSSTQAPPAEPTDNPQTQMNGATPGDPTSTQAPPAEGSIDVDVEVKVNPQASGVAVDAAETDGRTANGTPGISNEDKQDPEAVKGYFAKRAAQIGKRI